MTDESIQRAIEALSIVDVIPRNLSVTVNDDFDQKYGEEPVRVQWRHGLKQMTILEVKSGEAVRADDIPLVHFTFETGLRYLAGTTEDQEEVIESMVCAEILADIRAEYRLTNGIDEPSLEAFGAQNALFHIWPYWREIVQNLSARFRLPAFALPMYQLPQTNSEDRTVDGESVDTDTE